MKCQITAMVAGTILAITSSTLSVSATTTIAQEANPVPSSVSELATCDLVGASNSSNEQLYSAQLKDAQTLSFRGRRCRC